MVRLYVGCKRMWFLIKGDFGLHPLVNGVSVKLPAPGRNDGEAWCSS